MPWRNAGLKAQLCCLELRFRTCKRGIRDVRINEMLHVSHQHSPSMWLALSQCLIPSSFLSGLHVAHPSFYPEKYLEGKGDYGPERVCTHSQVPLTCVYAVSW